MRARARPGLGTVDKQGAGKRRQLFRERDLRRVERALKAEKDNRIIRINRDGSIELVPVRGDTRTENEWDGVK